MYVYEYKNRHSAHFEPKIKSRREMILELQLDQVSPILQIHFPDSKRDASLTLILGQNGLFSG